MRGSLEQHSEHPLAEAIVQYAQGQGADLAEPSNFEAVAGSGVHGQVEGKLIQIGVLSQKYRRGRLGSRFSRVVCRQFRGHVLSISGQVEALSA